MKNTVSKCFLWASVWILISCCTTTLKGQLFDDFSDGNFSYDPTWSGDTGLFRIDNYQLRLNSASGFDSSFVVTPNHSVLLTEWRFWVRLAFSPSDNNHPRIYLISNTSNLRGPVNGYFIQIGKSGSANKRLYLFRQNGFQTTELLAGADNLATTSNNRIRVKVVRNNHGNWQLYADGNGGELFRHQGEVKDATFTATQYFGVLCKYTSSNATRFYFDDFYIGPIVIDSVPPSIVNVRTKSSSVIEVMFSEAVDPVSATNINNYKISGGIGHPNSVEHSISDPARVTLTLDGHLQNASSYQLEITGVTDFAGNVLSLVQYTFSYYLPMAYDVVINEIMADPTPEIGLPGVEYIELLNRTEFPINIEEWIFRYGTTQRYFSGATILPGNYMIAGNATAISLMQSYGSTVEIHGLPSAALVNSGSTLAIIDASGNVIHSVSYTDGWYRSQHKTEGGWSLEQIDPDNPCGEERNWTASKDLSGGTPGKTNSVMAQNPDLIQPWIDRILITGENQIHLLFSEIMNRNSINNLAAFVVEPSVGSPVSITFPGPRSDAVDLAFNTVFDSSVTYELTTLQSMFDCSGNELPVGSGKKFAIPAHANPNDVVINEILFNPPTGCVYYIEIYNRSNKVIDLKQLRLTSHDTLLQQLTSAKEISTLGYLLFPQEYLVLSTNPECIRQNYFTPAPRSFLKMAGFPSVGISSGIAVIADANDQIIDRMIYDENMHFPLLNNFRGVSLERIHFDVPSEKKTTWHSASSASGYGTPGYQNSQFLVFQKQQEYFTINPEIFSPDNDGYNDILAINYKLPENGYMVTILIYNASGILVRRLVQNELAGTEGSFFWNGISDQNQKAPIGYYLILINLYDIKGNLKQSKKTAVLGGRL